MIRGRLEVLRQTSGCCLDITSTTRYHDPCQHKEQRKRASCLFPAMHGKIKTSVREAQFSACITPG
jgi:hypothetical protein